jgi:protein-tyrosine phosphatase
MAERLLTAGVAERAGASVGAVSFSSAGTRALVGSPMAPLAAQELIRFGGAPEGHRARDVTQNDLDHTDLLLALTRSHRSALVAMQPRLLRRTFTLREAGRLANLVAPELRGITVEDRLAELAEAMAPARGRLPIVTAPDDDVIDPYQQSEAVYAQCSAQLVPAVTAILDAIAPLTQPPRFA